jgi:hypothetical protein
MWVKMLGLGHGRMLKVEEAASTLPAIVMTHAATGRTMTTCLDNVNLCNLLPQDCLRLQSLAQLSCGWYDHVQGHADPRGSAA